MSKQRKWSAAQRRAMNQTVCWAFNARVRLLYSALVESISDPALVSLLVGMGCTDVPTTSMIICTVIVTDDDDLVEVADLLFGDAGH
jgi:hypothetical protein